MSEELPGSHSPDEQNVRPSPAGVEFDPNRAEFYYRLAERAQRRREVRQGHQWKAAFGIWALFALGAGTILASRESLLPSGHWSVTHRVWFWFAFLAIAVAFVAGILRFYWRFLGWVNGRNVNDSATGAFCEAEIRRALGAEELPDDLVPKELLDDNERLRLRSTHHAVLSLQFGTAFLLGILLLAAIVINMLKVFAPR
jgi:hypothetical protein